MTAPRIEDLRIGQTVEHCSNGEVGWKSAKVRALNIPGNETHPVRLESDGLYVCDAALSVIRIPEPEPKCDACLFGNAAHQCNRPKGHLGAHACPPDAKKPFVTWGWESAPFSESEPGLPPAVRDAALAYARAMMRRKCSSVAEHRDAYHVEVVARDALRQAADAAAARAKGGVE